MVNKGFPEFSRMQDGAFAEILKNYNLPDFILGLIAKECKSPLATKGRTYQKLQSMNNESLELLHKIFVKCEQDSIGKYAQYRFYAYVSSLYPNCEVLTNIIVSGLNNEHKVGVAIKDNGVYVAVAINKSSGNPISKKDTINFFHMITDIKNGEHGAMLLDAIYCSSVGFRTDGITELATLNEFRASDPENALNFKTVIYENNLYVIQKLLLSTPKN